MITEFFGTRGLRSNGTESHVKAKTPQQQAFQKALFSLNETYQLASKLFGTEIMNEIAGFSGSWFSAGSTGTPLNVTFCSDDDAQTPNNTVIGMIDEKNPDNSFSKGNIWKKSNDLIVSIPRASHLQGERN